MTVHSHIIGFVLGVAENATAQAHTLTATPQTTPATPTADGPDLALMQRLLTGLRRFHADCEGCNQPDAAPLTSKGYCVTCAIAACDSGDGDAVGLPTPADHTTAAQAMAAHLTTCPSATDPHTPAPGSCLVCALASSMCPECGTDVADVADVVAAAGNPEDGHQHLTMGGIVLVGCEGYVTPAARAAAHLLV